jgi:hypothetical protein
LHIDGGHMPGLRRKLDCQSFIVTALTQLLVRGVDCFR